jgi:hypothetical protein
MPRLSSINTFVLNSVIGSVATGDPEQANYQGATMVFVLQGSAPTGWVKDTSDNDYTLRCVTGSVSSGGSSGFSSVMSSKDLTGSLSVTGTVGGTSLTSSMIPSHNHGPYPAAATVVGTLTQPLIPGPSTSRTIQNQFTPGVVFPGGVNPGVTATAHDHPLNPATSPITFTTVDLAIKYVDSILATRT